MARRYFWRPGFFICAQADYVPIKQSTLDDLVRQITKLIATAHALMERYSRGYDELDYNHLALEEIRELLDDHFKENALWADNISRRMDRLERYGILTKTGDVAGAGEITQQVKGEHIRRALREELTNQRELLDQYQRNTSRVKIKIAKYGETIPLMNELESYELEVSKINEAIERIRDALK